MSMGDDGGVSEWLQLECVTSVTSGVGHLYLANPNAQCDAMSVNVSCIVTVHTVIHCPVRHCETSSASETHAFFQRRTRRRALDFA